jgi:diadenosine tetraphosphatase ApaH/serine/threonine PP2A family protein phosphatase
MARIAIIADIHGNVPALEAVLRDIERVSPDEIVVAGDLVGRGPQGSAVVKRIQALDCVCIRGNHEDYLLSFRRKEVPEGWLSAPEWACSRWMAAELDDDDIDFIDSLPFTAVPQIEPRLRIVHGSPESYNEGIGPWTKDERLLEHLNSIEEPAMACAHTHRPLTWHFDERFVINVGSVGLPFDGDTRAHYAIVWHDDGWHHEMRKVEYDLDDTLDVYRSSGFLEAGGATSALLERELCTARPHLVPFLKWA